MDFTGIKGLEYVGAVTIDATGRILINGEPLYLTGTPTAGQVFMRYQLEDLSYIWTNRTPEFPVGPDISDKVDKIPGKGLSTEDFTTELKALLEDQSGENTGDETEESILTKLGVDDVVQSSQLENLVVKEEGKSLIDDTEIERISTISAPYTIILPAASTVAGRIITPTELPSGWTLSVGTSALDLRITHGLTTKHYTGVKIQAVS